jgi:hypothetical protein
MGRHTDPSSFGGAIPEHLSDLLFLRCVIAAIVVPLNLRMALEALTLFCETAAPSEVARLHNEVLITQVEVPVG